jgi:hypothetical protein
MHCHQRQAVAFSRREGRIVKGRVSIATVVLMLLAAGIALAQQAETEQAFERYIADSEARITRQRSSAESFLSTRERDVTQRLKSGEVVIQTHGNSPQEIHGGLVHDWTGTVFIPGVNVEQVLKLVKDYDHLERYYTPNVIRSRLISQQGDELHVFLRMREHKVVTVVLDTEYDVHYGQLDATHQYSISRSTRVSEIADAGSASEHALTKGRDHGFMWRLNTYWAFEQERDGVAVECEAISLTRDIPTGLDWLIGSFVTGIPRKSLQFTLEATRNATITFARR